MAKGGRHFRQQQTQTEDTTFEVDNSLVGKVKFSSDNNIVVYSVLIGVFVLILFFIYAKYWHKNVKIKWRNRKTRRRK